VTTSVQSNNTAYTEGPIPPFTDDDYEGSSISRAYLIDLIKKNLGNREALLWRDVGGTNIVPTRETDI